MVPLAATPTFICSLKFVVLPPLGMLSHVVAFAEAQTFTGGDCPAT